MVNSHLSANTAETVRNMSDFMTQGMYGCSLVYDQSLDYKYLFKLIRYKLSVKCS